MYRIATRNIISKAVEEILGKDAFTFIENGDCEGIVLRSADLNQAELPSTLLAIARAGAGYNNIPVDKCTQQGIAVFNTPGANANAVKELVICALLLGGRKIVPAIEWLQKEVDSGATGIEKLVESGKNQFVGPELAGKKLGVIGLGAIGVMVANAASLGLDMEVYGYDPYISVDAAWHLTRAVKHTNSLDSILESCDYVTLHLPLNDATRGMIDAAAIAKMKPNAVLLNFSRAGLVDDTALLAALDDEKIARYITDFPNEAVAGHENVLAIPHLGASTPESEENCTDMAARQLRDYLVDGELRNSVNLPDCALPRTSGVRVAVIHGNITNMLGQMTAIFADDQHNIENMINKSRGDIAYTIFDIDRSPSAACLEKLRALQQVVRVRVV